MKARSEEEAQRAVDALNKRLKSDNYTEAQKEEAIKRTESFLGTKLQRKSPTMPFILP
jgi:hypothetical protein